MTAKTETKTHEIDAAGRAAGRVASEVAMILMGKHKATYEPNNVKASEKVHVVNAGQIKIYPAKLDGKIYYRHTNYPGGLRTKTLKEVMADDPTKVIRMAVEKMLPKNKLRPLMLKNLKIDA